MAEVIDHYRTTDRSRGFQVLYGQHKHDYVYHVRCTCCGWESKKSASKEDVVTAGMKHRCGGIVVRAWRALFAR